MSYLPKKQFVLINNRHEVIDNDGNEVTNFIFRSVKDPMDFNSIRQHIADFIELECDVYDEIGRGINSITYCDDLCLHGHVQLEVYVTGLTVVTAELVRQCLLNGVPLTLMHFDKVHNNYKPQVIW